MNPEKPENHTTPSEEELTTRTSQQEVKQNIDVPGELQQEHLELLEDSRKKVIRYFDSQPDAHKRLRTILLSVSPFVEVMDPKDSQAMLEKLSQLENAPDPETFADIYISGTKNLFDLHLRDPRLFERLMREAAIRSGKRDVASDLITYKLEADQVSAHLYDTSLLEPYKSAKGLKKAALLRKDFQKALAHFVKLFEERPELKRIHGVSYLIAENPGLFESYGFVVMSRNLDEAQKREQFGETPRDVRVADLPREILLNMYDESGRKKTKTA